MIHLFSFLRSGTGGGVSGGGRSSACEGLLNTEHIDDCSPPGFRWGMGGGMLPFIAIIGGLGGRR